MTQLPVRSLQNLIDQTPDLVKYLSNETISPMWKARSGLLAQFIPPEFTNWRDEQSAWRQTAILWDQSHHMPELYVKGPDALKLLEWVGIHSLANFAPDRAKQFVACTPRGHVIGDCVAFCLEANSYVLVSGLIDLASRGVHVAGVTVHPDHAWMMQVARNVTDLGDGILRDKRYLILDRDAKYTEGFRGALSREGVEVIRLPLRAPMRMRRGL